jgi:hypothetical protein
MLPVTHTNEGRGVPVRNFGFDLPFQKLTPLWIGAGVSGFLGFLFGVGVMPFHWATNTIVTMVPVLLSVIYLKMFVEGALPATQRDKAAWLLSLKPDFDNPLIRRLPFIPGLRADLAMSADPEPVESIHPLLAMRERFTRLAGKPPPQKRRFPFL